MLYRLVTMSILPHIQCNHFGYLVNYKTIRSHIIICRSIKHRIQLRSHLFMTAHQLSKPLNIMHNTPRIMPWRTFGKRTSPLYSSKRLDPFPVFIFRTHKTAWRIKQILIILRFFLIRFGYRYISYRRGKTAQTPVAIGIFQCLGSSFDIIGIRYIPELVILFKSISSDRSLPTLCLSLVHHSL